MVAHDYMSREYVAKEAGYVFMYISNENATQVDVYFDDVTMTYTPSNVIQYNEYYTHGMPNTNSWTRDNATGNNFLANGGTELNSASNLYDLDYRNYDPILGRMNGVDPMADKYGSLSPYNFSFNMPNMVTDPGGADPNPGEPDYVKTQNLGPFVSNHTSWGNSYSSTSIYRSSIFNQGWSVGSGSLSSSLFQVQDEKIFLQQAWTDLMSTPYAQASFVMGENGVNQGYSVLLNIAGNILSTVRSNNVEQAGNGGWVSMGSTTIIDFVTSSVLSYNCSTCLDNSSTHRNIDGMTHPGANNPVSNNGNPNYEYVPTRKPEFPAIGHDRRYDRLRAVGAQGLFLDPRAIGADWQFVKEELAIAFNPHSINQKDKVDAFHLALGLGISALPKTIIVYGLPGGSDYVSKWYKFSSVGVTNIPGK